MRRTVILLVLAGLLPIIVLSASFGAATLIHDRNSLAANVEGRARYAAALVGRELDSDKRATDTIAQSTAFDGNFAAASFRPFLERLVAREHGWRRIRVSDAAGKPLLAVPAVSDGQNARGVIDKESFRWAVSHQRADIGRVVLGRGNVFAVPVRAPVVRNGHVGFVVTTVIPSETLRTLLLDQQLPQGWHAEIIDGDGNVVASTYGDRVVGKAAAGASLDARRSGRTSFYMVARPDGSSDLAMWAAVPSTNWTIHISAPSELFTTLWHGALALVFGALILSLCLFWGISRLITRGLKETRLREAAEVQSQRMEALGRLTGGVAHDFNNLLTPIVGGLDLLRRRVTEDAKSIKYIDAAILSADRAKTLVGRLLAYSRRQPLTPQDIDVSRLIEDLTDLLDRTTGPGIVIEKHVPAHLPLAFADPAQLELAILNLAINARDAMPGGGTIRISVAEQSGAQTLKLGLPLGRYMCITVSDEGTGMDPTTLRNATEPFFTTKPAERGTGLGLSMVQGFAAQSGGALHLASTIDEGTQATICVPLSTVRATVKAELAPPSDTSSDTAQRANILLVDDEPDVRAIAADALQTAGHFVTEAGSMAEALELMKRQPFDVVVTDYLMPGGSGGDLILAIRARHPGTGTVVVSGYISSMESVPTDVLKLSKPFTMQQLTKAILEVI